METERDSVIRYNEAAMRVCIDHAENGILCGRVYGMRLADPILFKDFITFFVKIDRVMDEEDLPQSFQKKRQFKGVPKKTKAAEQKKFKPRMSEEAVQASKGDVATFTMRITSRQNTSWQGHLVWQDSSDVIHFRSVLELSRLVYTHLDGLQK